MTKLNISNSELEIMKALWRQQPLTVGQVIERVKMSNDWHDNTIKTLLNRLLKKELAARFREGGRFFYQPLVTEEDYLTQESEGLLTKFFEGKMAPLVAHFANHKKLTAKDVAEIQAILEQMKHD
ncbi:MAG: BlaI/MecI/CopY family transcriptional regulator [Pseudomonadota bacterium]